MILLHHPEVALSRALLANLPEGVEVIDGSAFPEAYSVSAYPSVVVVVPAYTTQRLAFNEAGEFIGMGDITVPQHDEILRMPASWEAVASFVSFVEARALIN